MIIHLSFDFRNIFFSYTRGRSSGMHDNVMSPADPATQAPNSTVTSPCLGSWPANITLEFWIPLMDGWWKCWQFLLISDEMLIPTKENEWRKVRSSCLLLLSYDSEDVYTLNHGGLDTLHCFATRIKVKPADSSFAQHLGKLEWSQTTTKMSCAKKKNTTAPSHCRSCHLPAQRHIKAVPLTGQASSSRIFWGCSPFRAMTVNYHKPSHLGQKSVTFSPSRINLATYFWILLAQNSHHCHDASGIR